VPTLRRREDFARISALGRSRSDRLMVVRFVPNGRDHDRFGISTGRRLGGAVGRNRLRRRVREILRHAPPHDGPGHDILIVMRPPATQATFLELSSAIERLLRSARSSAEAGT
jgi:ribonuclease P protein component